jgi:hypothetical protein
MTPEIATAPEKVKSDFGPPQEPVISPSECVAALGLAAQMYENIISRGDVPEEVLEWTSRVWKESGELRSKLRSELRIDSTGKDSDAANDAIMTALLPTFHHGSSQEEAGAALLSLILAGSKYGWMLTEEEPTQTETKPAPVLTSTSTEKTGPSGA